MIITNLFVRREDSPYPPPAFGGINSGETGFAVSWINAGGLLNITHLIPLPALRRHCEGVFAKSNTDVAISPYHDDQMRVVSHSKTNENILLNCSLNYNEVTIIHKIEDFLLELFPNYKQTSDLAVLKEELEKYYTYGVFRPKVSIEDGWAKVEIDTPKISSLENDYKKAVSLCEKGQYRQAKPILEDIIKKDPTNSEFHRIYGQVLSDEGNIDGAIDSLIDALRWDPKNHWALLLMGNLFAKFKDDVNTALKYYDKSLEANPNDNITLNNIGANLMQQGRIKEAQKYFWDAIKIDPDYPNTHYALALIAKMEGDLHSALYSAIEAIKKNPQKNELYINSVKDALSISMILMDKVNGKVILKDFYDITKGCSRYF